ncbi:hypothetical protein EJB05_23297 [Eragrostis curvula]|uniref:Uncharacterized protein n=1 Tax=Eragrostis curvula TaxID=38414 RepID=A0A5J9V5W8_9POAL|nr:hypothetical protein EJB05_23297 [Eragrostis curvula]
MACGMSTKESIVLGVVMNTKGLVELIVLTSVRERKEPLKIGGSVRSHRLHGPRDGPAKRRSPGSSLWKFNGAVVKICMNKTHSSLTWKAHTYLWRSKYMMIITLVCMVDGATVQLQRQPRLESGFSSATSLSWELNSVQQQESDRN